MYISSFEVIFFLNYFSKLNKGQFYALPLFPEE